MRRSTTVIPYAHKWKRSAGDCLVQAWSAVEGGVPQFFSDYIASQARGLRNVGYNRIVVDATDASVVVGMVFCKYEPKKNRLYVSSLAVRPTHQRQGIATALLDDVRAHAMLHAMRCVWLFVEQFNVRAQRLYTAYGFAHKKSVLVEPDARDYPGQEAITTNLVELVMETPTTSDDEDRVETRECYHFAQYGLCGEPACPYRHV